MAFVSKPLKELYSRSLIDWICLNIQIKDVELTGQPYSSYLLLIPNSSITFLFFKLVLIVCHFDAIHLVFNLGAVLIAICQNETHYNSA